MKNLLHLLFRRSRLDAAMAEEMRAHLEEQTQRNLTAGMSPDEARAAAHRQFGGVAQIQERARDQRFGRWLEELARDLRYGWRGLRRQPGFTLVAVLTLGFGIGVNSTVFSFIDDLIARPAARNHTQNLAVAHLERHGAQRGYRPFSYAEFEAIRDTGLFQRSAATRFATARLGPSHESRQRLVCLVSEEYFDVLGVAPLQGRFFHRDETAPNADVPAVVASYVYWQRLGAQPDFVGSQIEIEGRSFTVTGIAPREFGGLQWSLGPDLWAPVGLAGWFNQLRGAPTQTMDTHRWHAWNVIGNLAPGVSLDEANAGAGTVSSTLNALASSRPDEPLAVQVARPPTGNLDLTAPANEQMVTRFAAIALAVTFAVLLVACLNVANMLLARGTARGREIAVRLSLGATRARVVRQLITEGLLLGSAGAVLGLALSRVTNEAMLNVTRAISSGQPFAFHLQTTTSWRLLTATFALALVGTLVCSVVPALRATRLNLTADLKQVPASAGSNRIGLVRLWSQRDWLVMLQVSLSVVLLFCAGLFVRSMSNVANGRGFAVDDQLLVKVDYAPRTPAEKLTQLQGELAAQLAALPGVERVALASSVPYNFEAERRRTFPASTGAENSTAHPGVDSIITGVSHGYFETLGIPLLRGRDFTAQENAGAGPRVAIVDETLARQLFGELDPVGRALVFSAAEARASNLEQALTIVGVVRSPQEDPFGGRHPARLYSSLGQRPRGLVNIHVRTAEPEAVLATLRQTLSRAGSEHPVVFSGPLATVVENNLNYWVLRTLRSLLAVFGISAVLLAAVGVYGVKSYAVARRTREIGVRLALGATTRDVLQLILHQTAAQALVGVGLGAALSLGVGVAASKILHGASPTDPLVLGLAAATVIIAVLLAAAVPARRATRISPTEALRAE